MNSKKIKWSIIITDEGAPIYNGSIYPWIHTSSFQDNNHILETRLWHKIAFRRNTI